MSEAVFDGDNAKLTYRGYDDLLFWQGQSETHLLRLKNHRQNEWGRFLTGTLWNSPTEATTTFFFDGDDVKPTWGWKTTAKMSRGRFLTGKMWNSPTEATTTFFFDGDNANLAYRGYDDLLFWWVRCETHLPRLKDHRQPNCPPETKTRCLLKTMWI